jgi:NAD(P)-dependent dehydrogenase (short-subunit alcohol dehydrogenase family)
MLGQTDVRALQAIGHIAVTQTLLPALIRSNGRIINISSVGGKIAMATYGPYASTKFALEAVSRPRKASATAGWCKP